MGNARSHDGARRNPSESARARDSAWERKPTGMDTEPIPRLGHGFSSAMPRVLSLERAHSAAMPPRAVFHSTRVREPALRPRGPTTKHRATRHAVGAGHCGRTRETGHRSCDHQGLGNSARFARQAPTAVRVPAHRNRSPRRQPAAPNKQARHLHLDVRSPAFAAVPGTSRGQSFACGP